MSQEVHNPVAYSYAEAFFNLAKRKGILDSAAAGAATVLEVIRREREKLRRFLEGPQISTEAKLGLLHKALDGQVDELLVNLLCMLVNKSRIGLARDVLEIFLDKAAEERGIRPGQVTTAVMLDEPQKTRLRTALEAYTQTQLLLDFRVDARTLGGVIFRYKDLLVDSSVRGRLGELRRRLEGITAF